MTDHSAARRRRTLVIAVAAGIVGCVAQREGGAPPLRAATTDTSLTVGNFEGWPDGEAVASPWRHETFKKVTPATYSVESDATGRFLSGRTDGGGSLLTRPLDVDPNEFSKLRFRWRVHALPAGADVTKKKGDDCGARVFVTFAYEPEHASVAEKVARAFSGRDLPGSSLCYVWTDGLAAGSVLPSPYTDKTQMFVLRSGESGLGQWAVIERDIVADYERAFDHPPPRITGVAVMVDADQTGSRAAADFDEVELRR